MPKDINGLLNHNPSCKTDPAPVSHFDLDAIRMQARIHDEGGDDGVPIANAATMRDNISIDGHVGGITDRLGVMLAHRPGFIAPTTGPKSCNAAGSLFRKSDPGLGENSLPRVDGLVSDTDIGCLPDIEDVMVIAAYDTSRIPGRLRSDDDMNRLPLILSVGVADARLSDPAWADEMITLAKTAHVDLLLLGDGGVTPFDPLQVAKLLAPRAGAVGLVPTINVDQDLAFDVARALTALDGLTNGLSCWQPSTRGQPITGESVPQGVDFVQRVRDALTGGRPPQAHPLLVQTDADPLWEHVAPDIIIIDMDSPKPPPGPKCLLRTFTALAGLDQIETLYQDGIIDGIHLTPPSPRRGLQEFADMMLPALIDRGLVPMKQSAGTLRRRLGLDETPCALHAEPVV